MPNVIAVRFRNNPKQLWFDPSNVDVHEGDHVIVSTERGTEIGLAAADPFEVTDQAIHELPSALKGVIRVATEDDLKRADELATKGEEALGTFRELIEKHKLEMKPVRVDFIFGGEKVIFYFASEERVDFRELVRDLASTFHTRVDMRQIGVRDEARLVGGIAHCGQELCCCRLGGDFQPVSIRMAKEQDLPLNPLKISGLCGRLMCCLRYEFEAYKDFKGRAPKNGAIIETPLGLAKVCEFDTPREVISMRLEDGKMLHIPLANMECEKKEDGTCSRPCRVSQEGLEASGEADEDMSSLLGKLDRTLEDGVAAEGEAPSHQRQKKRSRGGNGGGEPRGNERSANGGAQAQDGEGGQKPRRRRRRGSGKGGTVQGGHEGGNGQGRGNGNGNGNGNGGQGQCPSRPAAGRGGEGGGKQRPGQHSSGPRNASQGGGGNRRPSEGQQGSGQGDRPKPRRRHPSSGNGGSNRGNNAGTPSV